MTKTCPSCGFVSNSEARFCRMCGALLPRAANEFGGDDAVSPSASTVPLAGSRPTTGALSPHDTGSPERPHTSRLMGGEMAEFLRRAGEAGDAAFGDGEQAAADGERPLTIRVRPIHSPLAATNEPPQQAPSSIVTPSNPSLDAAPDDDDDATIVPPVEATHTQSSTATTAAPSSIASAVATPSAAVDGSGAAVKRAGGDARPTVRTKSDVRRPTEDRALRIWGGAAVFGVIALLVAVGVVGVWYAVHNLRRAPAAEPTAATAPAAPTTEEARQSAAARLAEAEQLIAAGSESEAVAKLREAAVLDPSNAEPHRRLARLLLKEGARRTAIEELRAVVRLDANDADGWRALASAQSAEGSHADAAESYHTLFGVSAEAARDDRTQLLYADALRLSGRASEAQALYKRLAASSIAEVARQSRQHLSTADEAGAAKNADANLNANGAREAALINASNDAGREGHAGAEAARATDANKSAAEARPTPATLPVAASSKDHFERGVELWRMNRRAALTEMGTAAQKGNADASYYLGLNLAEGRDPRALKRAELVAALTYFQRARRSRFAAEARHYEDSLGREYDRRRAGEP
ncbi:MAG: tetratricopeptide repeat protein [Pyrinomonadaceae bacterium]